MNSVYAKNEVSDSSLSESKFSVNYLDVGQGNSSVVFLPDGKVAVIDGGSSVYGEKIYKFLTDNGAKKIDYLIATHADSDHIGGLNYLFDKFEISSIYRPFQICGSGTSSETFSVYEDEDLANVYNYYQVITNGKSKISRVTSADYMRFITNIYSEEFTYHNEKVKSDVTVSYDGLVIEGVGYSFEFFAPLVRDDELNLKTMSNTKGFATKGYGSTNSNDNSAIILLSVLEEKFLFSGDATWKDGSSKTPVSKDYAELDFIESLTANEKNKMKDISVFILGHHGSSYSSSSQLLSLISPRFIVVSVGENNVFGHPSSEVLFRCEKTKNIENDYLLRTDECGNIQFGEVDNKLCYSLEIKAETEKQTISWILFSSIVAAALITLIVFYKPNKKMNFFDFKSK